MKKKTLLAFNTYTKKKKIFDLGLGSMNFISFQLLQIPLKGIFPSISFSFNLVICNVTVPLEGMSLNQISSKINSVIRQSNL
jgi:hypothetical protein